MLNTKILHPIYLPFSEEEVKKHFIEATGKSAESNLKYYKQSIERYNKNETGQDIKIIRQIEKDEKFWTISTFLTLYRNKFDDLNEILQSSFGETPPFQSFNSWTDCLAGNIDVFFEANISSPIIYRDYLRTNIDKLHFIPYIIEKVKKGGSSLEGSTNVDAIILNKDNGFNIVIEAKVLSDIDYQTQNNTIRNQIARSIDVMLEPPLPNVHEPLDKRDPEKSLFLLVTPKLFKENQTSRLYGYKYNDYTTNIQTLMTDLPHRNFTDILNLSKRIGWITWEEIKKINTDCCKWLE